MLTLDEIKRRLKYMKLRQVSRESGVHENVLYRLVRSETNPQYETVERLSNWLEKQECNSGTTSRD